MYNLKYLIEYYIFNDIFFILSALFFLILWVKCRNIMKENTFSSAARYLLYIFAGHYFSFPPL